MCLGEDWGPIGPVCVFSIKKAYKWLKKTKSDILPIIILLLRPHYNFRPLGPGKPIFGTKRTQNTVFHQKWSSNGAVTQPNHELMELPKRARYDATISMQKYENIRPLVVIKAHLWAKMG